MAGYDHFIIIRKKLTLARFLTVDLPVQVGSRLTLYTSRLPGPPKKLYFEESFFEILQFQQKIHFEKSLQ